MKAILRKTGELVDIICFASGTSRDKSDYVSYIDSKGLEYHRVRLNYYWDFNHASDVVSGLDWEQRRFELTKAAMNGLIGCCSYFQDVNNNMLWAERGDNSQLATQSISIADEVIKQLKEIPTINSD